jgi:hypothetical protein
VQAALEPIFSEDDKTDTKNGTLLLQTVCSYGANHLKIKTKATNGAHHWRNLFVKTARFF